MYNRELQSRILRLAAQFPVLSITGPRQSGKTTLCKMLFSDYEYYDLEDERNLDMVQRDINGFLRFNFYKLSISNQATKINCFLQTASRELTREKTS